MWTLFVVVFSPLVDHVSDLSHVVEYLTIQQFISHLSVEGLAVAVLPGAPWRDVNRLRAEPRQPQFPVANGS